MVIHARDGDEHPMQAHGVEEWERTYAQWQHLGALIACIVAAASAGIGFWLPPLVAIIMWLSKRERSRFIDDHGREALNFQITLVIYGAIAGVLGFITCGVGWFIGVPLIFVLGAVGLGLGASAASRGRYYRYPACLRLV